MNSSAQPNHLPAGRKQAAIVRQTSVHKYNHATPANPRVIKEEVIASNAVNNNKSRSKANLQFRQGRVGEKGREIGATPSTRIPKSGELEMAAPQPGSMSSESLWLRDACNCPRCVDQSTRQKLFQTSDLPLNIEAKVVAQTDTAVTMAWENDIPAYGSDHISTYQKGMLSNLKSPMETGVGGVSTTPQVWDENEMAENIKFFEFADYQVSENVVLEVLSQLKSYGIVFLKGVPSEESGVEAIAKRIGHLRETFYGRTWDVRSVPEAKNVAYTNQYLGFHMDLLYMSDPPGLQLLHCLRNTCEGGTSMFSDALKAIRQLRSEEATNEYYNLLSKFPQTFHYKNAGEHYEFTRPVITYDSDDRLSEFVNWSPPFQAPFQSTNHHSAAFSQYVKAVKAFSALVEAPESIYEYRMQEGDCVIFNNRRVLHARRAFDIGSGERWLKGAYLDTDVFNSRYRVLHDRLKGP